MQKRAPEFLGIWLFKLLYFQPMISGSLFVQVNLQDDGFSCTKKKTIQNSSDQCSLFFISKLNKYFSSFFIHPMLFHFFKLPVLLAEGKFYRSPNIPDRNQKLTCIRYAQPCRVKDANASLLEYSKMRCRTSPRTCNTKQAASTLLQHTLSQETR